MLVRKLLIAGAAMSFTAMAAAEPAKPVAQGATQPVNRPAEVVLASAEQVSVPSPAAQDPNAVAQTPAAPVKKRAARVTSCRCGDQTTQR